MTSHLSVTLYRLLSAPLRRIARWWRGPAKKDVGLCLDSRRTIVKSNHRIGRYGYKTKDKEK